MTSSKPKKLVRVCIPRYGPIFHLHIIKIWQMKKNTYMHFEKESIIYNWSKFQLDTCMFDSNILLIKFGRGFWSRVLGVGPGFYSFPFSAKGLTDSAVITQNVTTGTGYCLIGFNLVIDFLNEPIRRSVT